MQSRHIPTLIFLRRNNGYVFSARGAAFIPAWGIAPGIRATSNPSAESATHSGTVSLRCVESRLQRSFMIRSKSWGDAPGYREIAPLALNKYNEGRSARKGCSVSHEEIAVS